MPGCIITATPPAIMLAQCTPDVRCLTTIFGIFWISYFSGIWLISHCIIWCLLSVPHVYLSRKNYVPDSGTLPASMQGFGHDIVIFLKIHLNYVLLASFYLGSHHAIIQVRISLPTVFFIIFLFGFSEEWRFIFGLFFFIIFLFGFGEEWRFIFGCFFHNFFVWFWLRIDSSLGFGFIIDTPVASPSHHSI